MGTMKPGIEWQVANLELSKRLGGNQHTHTCPRCKAQRVCGNRYCLVGGAVEDGGPLCDSCFWFVSRMPRPEFVKRFGMHTRKKIEGAA